MAVLQQNFAVRKGLGSSELASVAAYVFFFLGLLLAIGGFNLHLSGFDTREALQADAASLVSQVLFSLIYLVATAILLLSNSGRKILVKTWPIFLLPALAIISSAWSPDASLTLRRSFAYLGSVLFGVSLGSYFSVRETVCLITRALALAMILSVVWAVALPTYGVHQAFEAYPYQPIHAGYWRGIFAHRNVLGGFVGGFTFGLVVVFGRQAFRNWILWFIAVACTVACLIGANSGTGYVLAGVVLAALMTLQFVTRQKASQRLTLIVLLLIVVAFVSFFIDDLATWGLWLLGKSPDFTGRVPYWNYVLQMMDDSPLIGYGYFAGFALLIGPKITGATELTAIAPHNGILDLLVAFGYVGLVVGILVLAWALWRGIRAVALARNVEVSPYAAFPLVGVIFTLVHNAVESTLMLGNNIVVVILAVAVAMAAGAELDHN